MIGIMKKSILTLLPLGCILAGLLVPAEAMGDKVLVEFTAADGTRLTASGDARSGPGAYDREATIKRVQARAMAIAAARADLEASLPAQITEKAYAVYDNFPLVAMDITDADRARLLLHPQVFAVHDVKLRKPLMQSSLSYMGAKYWHSDGHTGEGTAVAVLDTGIRYWNGFFGSCPEPGGEDCRVKAFEGFATIHPDAGNGEPVHVANESAHGTNVGGIVGDIAPGTDLLSLTVFAEYYPDESTGWDGGIFAEDTWVAAALDWCINHLGEHNIVSANMSLGSSPDPEMTGYCPEATREVYYGIFANSRDAGILPVAATGNDYVKTAIGSPACVMPAVRVGAGYDDPAFGYECGTGPVVPGAVVCFSNSSSLVDVIAPGYNIDAGGLYGYNGTSMASPHMAGLIAVYQEYYSSNPLWTLERIRADAVPTVEIGPQQVYIHRYTKVGGHDALITFDSGGVLASSFEGLPIPDADEEGLEVSVEVACESELCIADTVGNVYLDLTIDHTRVPDLMIDLESPNGSLGRHIVSGEEELGLNNINSILGSQHLQNMFKILKGSSIEGTWKLRIYDDTMTAQGRLHKAVLFIDSARIELTGEIIAPEVARPDEPFDVLVNLENRGNLDITAAPLVLELVDVEGGGIVEAIEFEPSLPMSSDAVETHEFTIAAGQGSYNLRVLNMVLTPDLLPGYHMEQVPLGITYRTFASFTTDPGTPRPMEETQMVVLSRGLIDSYEWDFGDGNTSRTPDPVHIWTESGEYEVTLTVTGPDGRSSTARVIEVEVEVETPVDPEGGGCGCAVTGADRKTGPWLFFGLGIALLALSIFRKRKRPLIRWLKIFTLCLAMAAAAMTAAGCDSEVNGDQDAQTDGDGFMTDDVWLSLLDPVDPSAGDQTVYIMLSSAAPMTCDVTLEFRVNEGSFQRATLAVPTDAENVDTAPEGTELDLVWLATEDIPGDVENVQIKASADCGELDPLPIVSEPFLVLNFLVTHPNAILITEISTAEPNVPGDLLVEYIELFNTTDETINLDEWTLTTVSSWGREDEFLLDGIEIGGGRRITFVGPEAEGAVAGAIELTEDLHWDTAAGGAAWVIATYNRGMDFVRWGGHPALPPAGTGWTDDPALPIPQTLTVLNRIDDTTDTDRGSDFCVSWPSPGTITPGCMSRTTAGGLLITELSTQGSDDMVELLNASGESIDLGGWVLLWDGDDLGSGAIPLARFNLQDGDRIVLRDNGEAGRYSDGVLELGVNLNIDGLIPVAAGMQNPYGDVVDFLAAGGSKVRYMDWQEEEPTPMPSPLTTLSRKPGDPDTDSAADFCLTEPNLRDPAEECLEPFGYELRISEVMPGRPDWVEIYNAGSTSVTLSNVYLSYSAPYYGGSVNDYRLSRTLAPGDFIVVSERELDGVEGEIIVERNIALGSDGDGTVAIRDIYGFGIDFMMFGEPAGVPLWPDTWSGLGAELYPEDNDWISIQRLPHDAPDTNTSNDWCWGNPSPMYPNNACE